MLGILISRHAYMYIDTQHTDPHTTHGPTHNTRTHTQHMDPHTAVLYAFFSGLGGKNGL